MKRPQPPPSVNAALEIFGKDPSGLVQFFEARTLQEGYPHWDDLRYRSPPHGWKRELWWARLKLQRRSAARELPFLDLEGKSFTIQFPDEVLELFHRIDSAAAGSIVTEDKGMLPEQQDRHLVRSLMEEAISSSQLEGAATTRRVAKEMIRTGRPPRNHGERMILNNYHAMNHVKRIQGEELTVELLFELHRILTEETLPIEEQGRLRTDTDDVLIVDSERQEIVHRPPPSEELPGRLGRLCRLGNGADVGFFLHPLARSILLHFQLAYDHPFVDGNGRLARALFHWSMLRQGYWICEYISISSLLKKAPAQYGRAFLLVESDENDTTYFLLHQLRIVEKAIEEMHAYVRRKTKELRTVESLLRRSAELNHRQIGLLNHALRHPDAVYTIRSHGTSNAVAYATARQDLLDLQGKGLLVASKRGRTLAYRPAADLERRIRRA